MPYRRGGFSRRAASLRPVVSNKNVRYLEDSIGVALGQKVLVNTVDSATLAATGDVQRGCSVKAVWISLDFCGLAATGVLQSTTVFLMKNPGQNLTVPLPRTEDSSNEKKFIFKTWNQMTMRNQDGNPPYHWEGWVKIPKRYQRFGAADTLLLAYACTTAAGHISIETIYKWYL